MVALDQLRAGLVTVDKLRAQGCGRGTALILLADAYLPWRVVLLDEREPDGFAFSEIFEAR
jgi:hypothetical protein